MKHILNNISQEEKNSILEQHSGGMKIRTERFNDLLESKMGDVKPLINESMSMDDIVSKAKNVTPVPGLIDDVKECVMSNDLTTIKNFMDSVGDSPIEQKLTLFLSILTLVVLGVIAPIALTVAASTIGVIEVWFSIEEEKRETFKSDLTKLIDCLGNKVDDSGKLKYPNLKKDTKTPPPTPKQGTFPPSLKF